MHELDMNISTILTCLALMGLAFMIGFSKGHGDGWDEGYSRGFFRGKNRQASQVGDE
jgi:hypothetical protein